jgi:dipeptidyl-peptidase-3
MALAAEWSGILGENTPSRDTLRPAAAAVGVEAPPDRKYLLERVDDAAVVQLYADGFEKLQLKEKQLIFHLYQAAIAGRDIYYDQRYVHNLAMRQVLEEILTHASGVDPESLAEIHRYTKLFWLNTGPYNNLTARKFVLKVSPEELATAIKAAQKAGARFPTRSGETLDAMVARMSPLFLDASVDPVVTNKSPGPGKDLLASSANNLYADVTMKDLEGFEEKYPLNSRLVKRDGKPVEEVYRIGGRYDAEIRRIVEHLQAAIPFATAPMSNALRALVKWYQTGETADRVAYDIAWARTRILRWTRSTDSSRSTWIREGTKGRGKLSSSTSIR